MNPHVNETLDRFADPLGSGFIRNGVGGISPFTSLDFGPRQQTTMFSRKNSGWVFVHKYKRNPRIMNGPVGKNIRYIKDNFDLGSNFRLDRFHRIPLTSISIDNVPVPGAQRITYNGSVGINIGNAALKNMVLKDLYWPSHDDLMYALFERGGRAVSKTIPLQETVSLGQALIELLKDGLPKNIGSQLLRRGLNMRELAGEYLNATFGWEPLIRDVQSLANLVINGSEIILRYQQSINQHIRRRYDFKDLGNTPYSSTLTDATKRTINPGQAYLLDNPSSSLVYPRVERYVSQQTWFSGAYRTVSPVSHDFVSDLQGTIDAANYLLGIKITPDLLWEVSPWSWLFDWFVNIGDVLKNISYLNHDATVLQYGYIMQHTHVKAFVTLPGVRAKTAQSDVIELVEVDRKVRYKASPFGFGLDPNLDFSAKQWSILGALGLLRAPNKMW
jgi:hypothetical protein